MNYPMRELLDYRNKIYWLQHLEDEWQSNVKDMDGLIQITASNANVMDASKEADSGEPTSRQDGQKLLLMLRTIHKE